MGIGEAIQIGIDIMKSTVSEKTGRVLLNTGNAIGQVAGSDNVEQWQHNGFASRPPEADAGKAASQSITIRRGSHDVSIAEQDARGLELLGNIGPGETAVYAAGADGKSQGRALFKDDGRVALMTTDDNTKTGKAVALVLATDGLKFTAPWGSFTFDATGFHLKTKAGPRIDMGGISLPIAAPLKDKLSGYATITAPVIKLAGANVTLGAGSVFLPTVYAPLAGTPPPVPTQAAANAAMAAFLVSLASAMGASGAPNAGTSASAITAAAALLVATMAAAPPTTQSQTVWSAP